MKLTDRINEAVQVGIAEARNDSKYMAKLVGLGVVIVLGACFGLYQLFSGPSAPPVKQITAQDMAKYEEAGKELDAATEEETEAFEASVAAGDVQAPVLNTPEALSPLGAKGMTYLPGYDPTAARPSTPEPDPTPEPEPEQPEDPG